MGTRGQWAIDFLKRLGNATPDEKTVNLVAAWTRGENTEAKYNPLATTLDYGTNTKFNLCCGGNGVKNYSSREEGINASIMTLRGNHPGYSEIVKGLLSNDGERALRGMKYNVWGTNFQHVEAMWRGLDVTNDTLLSETATPPKIAGPSTSPGRGHSGAGDGAGTILPNPNNITPKAEQTDPNYVAPQRANFGITEDSVRNTAKIALGIVLAVASIMVSIMAIGQTDTAKNAVNVATSLNPTASIVKAVSQ